uniref:CKLF like MARVEL transmembrane domain containing 3 n=1 Tax=Canis lupus familiaris TaxID=9615 RepID=A0A8I3NKQ2_CANLF
MGRARAGGHPTVSDPGGKGGWRRPARGPGATRRRPGGGSPGSLGRPEAGGVARGEGGGAAVRGAGGPDGVRPRTPRLPGPGRARGRGQEATPRRGHTPLQAQAGGRGPDGAFRGGRKAASGRRAGLGAGRGARGGPGGAGRGGAGGGGGRRAEEGAGRGARGRRRGRGGRGGGGGGERRGGGAPRAPRPRLASLPPRRGASASLPGAGGLPAAAAMWTPDQEPAPAPAAPPRARRPPAGAPGPGLRALLPARAFLCSRKGRLLLAESGLSFITFVCYVASSASAFLAAPLLEFLLALYFLFADAMQLNDKWQGLCWPMMDFLRCVTAALIYFAISITAVAKYSDAASKAAGVFGFFATIVFAVDFYLIFNDVAKFLKEGDSTEENTADKAEEENSDSDSD